MTNPAVLAGRPLPDSASFQLNYEEAVHKLMKINIQEGQEVGDNCFVECALPF